MELQIWILFIITASGLLIQWSRIGQLHHFQKVAQLSEKVTKLRELDDPTPQDQRELERKTEEIEKVAHRAAWKQAISGIALFLAGIGAGVLYFL